MHAINHLLYRGTLTNETIRDMVNTYVDNNSGLKVFSQNFKDNYKEACITFLSELINLDAMSAIKVLLKYYTTWDLYALSIMYLKFLKQLFTNGFFDNSFIIAFSKLLIQNISPNPNDRYDTKKTQVIYSHIFYINEKPSSYLTLIQELST